LIKLQEPDNRQSKLNESNDILNDRPNKLSSSEYIILWWKQNTKLHLGIGSTFLCNKYMIYTKFGILVESIHSKHYFKGEIVYVGNEEYLVLRRELVRTDFLLYQLRTSTNVSLVIISRKETLKIKEIDSENKLPVLEAISKIKVLDSEIFKPKRFYKSKNIITMGIGKSKETQTVVVEKCDVSLKERNACKKFINFKEQTLEFIKKNGRPLFNDLERNTNEVLFEGNSFSEIPEHMKEYFDNNEPKHTDLPLTSDLTIHTDDEMLGNETKRHEGHDLNVVYFKYLVILTIDNKDFIKKINETQSQKTTGQKTVGQKTGFSTNDDYKDICFIIFESSQNATTLDLLVRDFIESEFDDDFTVENVGICAKTPGFTTSAVNEFLYNHNLIKELELDMETYLREE
jgi:hypothetical protein